MSANRAIWLTTGLMAASLTALLACASRFDANRKAEEERIAGILRSYLEDSDIVDNSLGEGETHGMPQYIFIEPGTDYLSKLRADIKALKPPELVSGQQFLDRACLELTKGTRFDGKIQINRPPQRDTVNIYVLRRDPKGITQTFHGNCTYIGWMNAIVCDAAFLRRMLAEIDAYTEFYDLSWFIDAQGPIDANRTTPEMQDEIRRQLKACFLLWIIGHEIGHAVLHYDYVTGRSKPIHLHDAGFLQREQEADRFVAESFARHQDWASWFWLALSEIFQHEYRKHMPPDSLNSSDNPNPRLAAQEYLSIQTSTYDLPLVVRCIRMLCQMVAVLPKLDLSGYHNEVNRHITVVEHSEDVDAYLLVMTAVLLILIAESSRVWPASRRG